MKTFKLLKGVHKENGINYDAETNAIVQSNKPLDQMFANKFQEMAMPVTVQPQVEQTEPSDEGEDVTAKFKEAEEAGFVITKNGKRYTIHDSEGNFVDEVLNRKNVTETVRELLNESDAGSNDE